jgi:hypothetical protein
MLPTIALGCFWLSVVSFILFAICVLVGLIRRPGTAAGGLAGGRQEGAEEGWAKLAEALAKLVDSLNKSGLTTLSIIASFVFMILSLIAAKG